MASGHRVRIATHGVFEQFVRKAGLEFFPIGGNPEELMSVSALSRRYVILFFSSHRASSW